MARRPNTLTPRRTIEQDARRISQALDTDDVDIEDQGTIDAQDSPGSISWSTGRFVRMYQPRNYNPSIGARRDPDTIWYPSPIYEQIVNDKAKMKNARGERMWYRESEIPTDARIYDAMDGATLKCPIPSCGVESGNGPKMLKSWAQMQAHLDARHSVEAVPYKKFIEDKVAGEVMVSMDKFTVGVPEEAAG